MPVVSLPPNVRVQDVANVIGRLEGLRGILMPMLVVGGGMYVTVPGVEISANAAVPQTCTIVLRKKGIILISYNYHFECQGGRRELSGDSELCRALVDFFGGNVDDGYTVIDKSDSWNHPEDAVDWENLQQRIFKLKRLK